MKVKDVMTRDVRTIRADTPIKEAAGLLAEHGISGLPVVDADGMVIGVLSESDIVARESGDGSRSGLLARLLDLEDPDFRERLRARPAGEAMSSPAVTITPGRSVHEAAGTMLDEGVNRLPVVDTGMLVGIVTRADLVKAFVRSDEEIATELREEVVRRTLWLDPDLLSIRVDRGEATITGTVNTTTDAELLDRFARRVPGVVDVRVDVTPREPAGAAR